MQVAERPRIGTHEVYVVPHNTMRFDVNLTYPNPMVSINETEKSRMVTLIREAIIEGVKMALSVGWDGEGTRGCISTSVNQNSPMLHLETIYFDFH